MPDTATSKVAPESFEVPLTSDFTTNQSNAKLLKENGGGEYAMEPASVASPKQQPLLHWPESDEVEAGCLSNLFAAATAV